MRGAFGLPSYFSVILRLNHRLHYRRIAQLEMLDEVEELELVLAHYVIAFGVKASDPESPFASWNLPAALPVVR